MTRMFFALLLAGASTTAFAEPATVRTGTVAVADLDLSSEAGRRAFDRRATRTVIELCGVASDADLAGQNDVRTCRADALASVANQRDRRIATSRRLVPATGSGQQ